MKVETPIFMDSMIGDRSQLGARLIPKIRFGKMIHQLRPEIDIEDLRRECILPIGQGHSPFS
jgi:hypothetical protein